MRRVSKVSKLYSGRIIKPESRSFDGCTDERGFAANSSNSRRLETSKWQRFQLFSIELGTGCDE